MNFIKLGEREERVGGARRVLSLPRPAVALVEERGFSEH